MPFVTPADMEALYDDQILVQITNYSDRTATAINQTILESACNAGNQIISGFLLSLGIPESRYSEAFRNILQVHAARLAMDFMAGTDPQVRDQARESMEWLKTLPRMSKEALRNLAEEPGSAQDEPPIPGVTPVLPSVSYAEGHRWGVML